jgi:DinB family protein
MGRATDLLAAQMDEAYSMLLARLEGLTEDEFFWEAAPGAWNITRGEDGRWTSPYEEPDPVPAPLTTIGWRLVHLAQCKPMYHEYAFGPGRLTWDTIETPGTVEGCVAMLEDGQRRLLDDLAGLGDDDLDGPVMTNWGEAKPAWWIFWTMVHHDLWHGGEIGALRDLYRERTG